MNGIVARVFDRLRQRLVVNGLALAQPDGDQLGLGVELDSFFELLLRACLKKAQLSD